ncbi:hypothetical protein B0I37DRAFT_409386 [Chaetomium sp. MPI-CAGE-AT-0009]|nr:hypothetical protein B0I37DRAFT_409386 [Chaetomium sp. MPI-CAGE-AT-0009]
MSGGEVTITDLPALSSSLPRRGTPEKLHPSLNSRSLDAILVHTRTHTATIHLHLAALQHTKTRRASYPRAEGILAIFRAAAEYIDTAIRNLLLLSLAAYMAASVFPEDQSRASSAGGATLGA